MRGRSAFHALPHRCRSPRDDPVERTWLYLPEHYGIRLENLLLVQQAEFAAASKPFLRFETLTLRRSTGGSSRRRCSRARACVAERYTIPACWRRSVHSSTPRPARGWQNAARPSLPREAGEGGGSGPRNDHRAHRAPVRGNQAFRRARSIGARVPMLLLRHILPGTLPSVIMHCSLRVGASILTAAVLSFIGLGAPPPRPEWGRFWRRDGAIRGLPTRSRGLAIFITVLAFNLLGDGLRDALDQKLG